MLFPTSRYSNKTILSCFAAACLGLLLLMATNNASARLYKWIDENGNVSYSDKIPPQANQGSHSLLSDKGVTLKTREAQKTREEILRQQEIEQLRKQKEIVIRQQEASDKVLLKSFRTEEDLMLAREGKIRSVDNLINITRGNIKRFKDKLSQLQSKAAEQEKTGEVVSEKFMQDMEAIKRQINTSYASIANREDDKNKIREAYAVDIKRFRVLKKLNASETQQAEEQKVTELNTVFHCTEPDSCNQAWKKSIDYVKQHATTRVQLLGERIYMTQAPVADTDISLTVARIKDSKSEEEMIFLDQQCRRSLMGEEFCNQESVKDIKRNFISSISR